MEDVPQPDRDLTALDDVRGRTGVEVEYERRGLREFFRQRKGRVQLERAQLRQPDKRGEVLGHAVEHVAVVAAAPDLGSLDPGRPVLRAVLFVEELPVDAV